MRASCGISAQFAADRGSVRHGLPGLTAVNANLLRRSYARQSAVHTRQSVVGGRSSSVASAHMSSQASYSSAPRVSTKMNRSRGLESHDTSWGRDSGDRTSQLLLEIKMIVLQMRVDNNQASRQQELQIASLHEDFEEHADRLAALVTEAFQKKHGGVQKQRGRQRSKSSSLKVASKSSRETINNDSTQLSHTRSQKTYLHSGSSDALKPEESDFQDSEGSMCSSKDRVARIDNKSLAVQENGSDRLELEASNGNIERRNKLAFSSLPAPKEDAPVPWSTTVASPTLTAAKVLRLAALDGARVSSHSIVFDTETEVPIGRAATDPGSKDSSEVPIGRAALESSPNGHAAEDAMDWIDMHHTSTRTQILGFGPMAMALSEGPLELSENWVEKVDQTELHYVSMRAQSLTPSLFAQAMEGAGFIQEESIWGKVFGDPYSIGNTFWSALCLFMVISDLIVVPLIFFDGPYTPASKSLLLGTTIFWAIDFFLSFFKGYFEDGIAITSDVRRMAGAYIKTWFGMDLVIVIVDFIYFVAIKAADYQTDSLGFWKGLRVVRLLRILKLRKFLKRIEVYVGSIWSSHVLAYFTVLKFIIGILVCNHLVACVFYATSWVSLSDKTNWVSLANMVAADWEDKYVAAFHWSLAHFTGGEVDIIVQNGMERIFACAVLLFGLIMVSWLVSTTTNAMLLLAEVDQHKRKQITLIRHFCKQHKLDKNLCYRIQRYVKFAYEEKRQQMMLGEIEAFQLLSEPLLAEIYHEIYSPCISGSDGHPLFQKIHRKAPTLMNKVCRNAVSLSGLAGGDCAFSPGELARRMYFVLNGQFLYRLQSHGSFELYRHHWLGEAALWTTTWTHRGQLQAKMESELLMVDAHEFAVTIRTHPRTYIWVQQYAKRYVDDLNLSQSSGRSDMDMKDDDRAQKQSRASAFDEDSKENSRANSWRKLPLDHDNDVHTF